MSLVLLVRAQAPDTVAKAVQQFPSGAMDTTSINVKDMDIRDIFRGLSSQYGLNIILDNSINKKVTISLTSVQVHELMKFLCKENNLALAFEAGIFRISPPAVQLPPPPKPLQVDYENSLFSVDLKNEDLEKVILEIGKKCDKNILIISGTSGSVGGRLKNIDFDLGFTQLMNNNGFAVQKKSGIYLVSRLDYYVGTQGTTTAQQKSGPYWISVKDSLVSIDVTNAPLERVVANITRQLNTDVIFYGNVTGNVTIRATNVTLTSALNKLFRNSNFTYAESEGMYFIGEKTNKSLVTNKLLKMKYMMADKVMESLPQTLSSQATIKVIKEQNGIVIVGSADIVQQVEDYVREIDKPVAQVLIEALVVDFDISHGTEFGIQSALLGSGDTLNYRRQGTLTPGIDYNMKGDYINKGLQKIGKINLFGAELNIASLGHLPSDFFMNVKALEHKGVANIKSHPILATLNGTKATLSIGTTQYYKLTSSVPLRDMTQTTMLQTNESFTEISADVKLEITPYVGSDGLITVDIKPDFRTPVGTLNSETPPTINKRAMSSTLEVREGETIVLGGMVSETDSEDRDQVPIIGSIPLLGGLFSSTNKTTHKTQLMIYVTPHISYGEAFNSQYNTPPASNQ